MTDTMTRLTKMNDDRAWQAVLDRDEGWNGRLFYGVLTTGIYCRPTCPSRRPNRVNVRFFRDRLLAERAGFRPCKRCTPQVPAANGGADLAARATSDIEQHLDGDVSLAAISDRLGCSPFHLQRTFKRVTGVSPRQYAAAKRADRVRHQLQSGKDVTMSLYDSGYTSSSHFYANAGAELGMTPSAYRARGAGTRIMFGSIATSIGRVLVARTDRGVCSIRIGDNVSELEQGLREEFAAATIEHDQSAISAEIVAVTDVIHASAHDAAVPLDVRGTAFQRRVWEHLRTIPRGQTRTYQEVAAGIGQPTASRAVASACAKNPVALVVPCHRVVRSDGGLGGYRWGIERKRQLLVNERGNEGRA